MTDVWEIQSCPGDHSSDLGDRVLTGRILASEREVARLRLVAEQDVVLHEPDRRGEL